ncbi:hypothetical protein FISHEDRAFT_69265 [Fistulina hepatica ATCC 64428]|uniref:HMG box domain-containing protein n=1 Tax=Fistulina hepatica ATCC 64428 TaxID=1128425 RepID=A0A0D7ANG1_9AGAR|nr:hypothetical protein FISHEDRAFT_69265 [Fistulina hepatica ATCC 64428]
MSHYPSRNPADSSPSGSDEGSLAAPANDNNDADENAALIAQTLNPDGTPKRPMNAFMIFARRRRPQVSAVNQSMRTGEISKILSKEWNDMSASDKQFYLDQAKHLKDNFNKQYPEYVYRRKPNNTARRRRRADSGGSQTGDLTSQDGLRIPEHSVSDEDRSPDLSRDGYPRSLPPLPLSGYMDSESHPASYPYSSSDSILRRAASTSQDASSYLGMPSRHHPYLPSSQTSRDRHAGWMAGRERTSPSAWSEAERPRSTQSSYSAVPPPGSGWHADRPPDAFSFPALGAALFPGTSNPEPAASYSLSSRAESPYASRSDYNPRFGTSDAGYSSRDHLMAGASRSTGMSHNLSSLPTLSSGYPHPVSEISSHSPEITYWSKK